MSQIPWKNKWNCQEPNLPKHNMPVYMRCDTVLKQWSSLLKMNECTSLQTFVTLTTCGLAWQHNVFFVASKRFLRFWTGKILKPTKPWCTQRAGIHPSSTSALVHVRFVFSFSPLPQSRRQGYFSFDRGLQCGIHNSSWPNTPKNWRRRIFECIAWQGWVWSGTL